MPILDCSFVNCHGGKTKCGGVCQVRCRNEEVLPPRLRKSRRIALLLRPGRQCGPHPHPPFDRPTETRVNSTNDFPGNLLDRGFGLLLGVLDVLVCGPLVASLLFGLQPADVFAALLISIVALASGYIPARRASRIDPVAALRFE